MTNNNLTDFYQRLRASLAEGLDNAEAKGALPEDAIADLMRVAVVLSIGAVGARDTVIALRGLLRQLEKQLPEAKKAADDHFAAWDRRGGNA